MCSPEKMPIKKSIPCGKVFFRFLLKPIKECAILGLQWYIRQRFRDSFTLDYIDNILLNLDRLCLLKTPLIVESAPNT